MGPVESNPDRYAGAWRLLIWAPLLVLAVASRFVLPSSWAGLVALWGWAPLLAGVAAVWAVVGFLGHREWRHHTDHLESIPIRIHVDGSRGKTGTCRLIGAALRANGLRVRSEEHTSELQSRQYLVCRLLLEKKKNHQRAQSAIPRRPGSSL